MDGAKAKLPVRLGPRSSRNAIDGVEGGRLVVKVSAAPVDGKANAALCELIAKALGVPKSRVSIRSGHSSREKVLEVEGVQQSAVDETFGFVDRPGLFQDDRRSGRTATGKPVGSTRVEPTGPGGGG